MQARFLLSALCAIAMFGSVRMSAGADRPADWPRFRGPNVDGISPEKGLLQTWPQGGPQLLWKLEGLGTGYSTIAIADGRILTMGDREEGGEDGQFVLCFQLADRKLLWATRVGNTHNDGPRCTPTVDGDRTYAIGTDGDLVCLETATGRLAWKKNFRDDFGGRMMSVWKFSESPLVDGDKLLCTPGGPDAAIVALDKRTGEVIWKSALPDIGDRGKDGAGYSSMIAADIDGVRQYIQILGRGAVGVAADDGRLLWSYNKIANRGRQHPDADRSRQSRLRHDQLQDGQRPAAARSRRQPDEGRGSVVPRSRTSSRTTTAAWYSLATTSTAATDRTTAHRSASSS